MTINEALKIFGRLSAAGGRWIFLVLVALAAWWLVEAAVHPMLKAAPFAKTLSALIGYGLVVTLVCIMRWSPLQPLLAPLFDEITHLARIAFTGYEKVDHEQVPADAPRSLHRVDPLVRAGAMIAIAVYGGLTFAAVVLAGAMLAGVAH